MRYQVNYSLIFKSGNTNNTFKELKAGHDVTHILSTQADRPISLVAHHTHTLTSHLLQILTSFEFRYTIWMDIPLRVNAYISTYALFTFGLRWVYGAHILPVSPYPCGLCEASLRRQEAAVRFSYGFTGSAASRIWFNEKFYKFEKIVRP